MTEDEPGGATEAKTASERLMLQRGFIVILALLVSAVFLWMIRDFLGVLFLAAVLAIFLLPVQASITKLLGGRARLAASLVVVLALLILILPLTGLFTVAGYQAMEISQTVIPWAEDRLADFREQGMDAIPGWIPFRDAIAPYSDELSGQVASLASSFGSFVVGALRSATRGTIGFFLNAVVLVFALFLFLMSGKSMAANTINLLPMPQEDRQLLAQRTLSTIRATVKGTFVIALVQGGLVGVALAMAGLQGAVFWGAVAGILSIVPAIGPPLVWVPAAIILWLDGQYGAAIALGVFGAAVISTVDNVLRPMLVGKDTKMPDLMVLLSMFGGLTLFGAMGLIIGPVIAALFLSVWYIYAQSYAPFLVEGGDAITIDEITEDDEIVGGDPKVED